MVLVYITQKIIYLLFYHVAYRSMVQEVFFVFHDIFREEGAKKI